MAVFLAKLSLSRSRSRVRDPRRLDFSGAQSFRGLLKATRTATGVGVVFGVIRGKQVRDGRPVPHLRDRSVQPKAVTGLAE